MKLKYVAALLLMLAGTNLFTFATTRYVTTRDVLTTAEERMEAALKKEGLYEKVYPSDRPRSVRISLAISQAGGEYYWWNDGLLYWAAGALITAAGALVFLIEVRKQNGT